MTGAAHAALAAAARDHGDREGLVVAGAAGARWTWGEVAAAAWRFAHALRARGVARGDRVAIACRNGLEYVAAYHGVLAAGAVAVPAPSSSPPSALAAVLADCGARALVVERARTASAAPPGIDVLTVDAGAGAPASTPVEPVRADALAAIVYTSGTTGRPRGVALTHGNFVANLRSILAFLPVRADDRVLAVLPFHYAYGHSVLATAIAAGAAVVVENRFCFPSVVMDTLEDERCTGLAGVPATYAILLDRAGFAERALPALRWATQAGGAMTPALTRRLLLALRGRALYVMYGATEATARLAFVPPDELADCVGSIGRAIPGVELTVRRPDGEEAAVDEVGELVARGDSIMRGYWDDPEATARALGPHGYRTGDLARRDASGRLWLVGRVDEQLKIGGRRVSAREVEDALGEHPGVSEVAVVGFPDETLGARLAAFVVPRGPGAVDPQHVARFAAERLPPHAVPRRVVLRTTLPRNAAGKVVKRLLREEDA